RDDDDINDVASMAGVNLNEESARIMATNSDLVGTQMQSCKDEPFLAAIPLHKRILETGEKHILSFWECFLHSDEVLRNRICLALKMECPTTFQNIPQYSHTSLERVAQSFSLIYFLEAIFIIEVFKGPQTVRSRPLLLLEELLRSRQEDPEQARLKQKAKEMQQQELAQMRQRDANLTALAAIGPRKKRKLDAPGLLTIGGEGAGLCGGGAAGLGTGSPRQYPRQKITRVNLRDFIFYMEQEREMSHSLLLYRALLK
ncbi:TAF4 factor, partial [Passerina amoena]|nr:TAF4 factor [Passerina amoena]